MGKQYFIFSNPHAKDSILENGIIAHEKRNILMSDNKFALEFYASDRLRLRHYSIYEISEIGAKIIDLTSSISVLGTTSLYLLEGGYINPAFVKHLHDVIPFGAN